MKKVQKIMECREIAHSADVPAAEIPYIGMLEVRV